MRPHLDEVMTIQTNTVPIWSHIESSTGSVNLINNALVQMNTQEIYKLNVNNMQRNSEATLLSTTTLNCTYWIIVKSENMMQVLTRSTLDIQSTHSFALVFFPILETHLSQHIITSTSFCSNKWNTWKASKCCFEYDTIVNTQLRTQTLIKNSC